MALQHELSNAGMRIPELDAAIFRTGQDPVAVRGEGNAQDKVLQRGCMLDFLDQDGRWGSRTLWPSKVRMHLPPGAAPGIKREGVVNSHILIVLSKLPLTSLSPEGAKATE